MGETMIELLATFRSLLLIVPLRRKTMLKYFSGLFCYCVPTFSPTLLKEFLGVKPRKNESEKGEEKLHIKK